MILYKTYLKILSNQKNSMAVLLLIFLFMFFIYNGDVGYVSFNEKNEFKDRKTFHLVIDEDESDLSAKSMEFLKQNGEITLIDKMDKIQIDEVYNSKYRGIIVFEKGFENSVLQGSELKLKYYSGVQEEMQGIGMGRLYSFLNTFYGYHKMGFGMDESYEKSTQNLSSLTAVEIHHSAKNMENGDISSKLGGLGNAIVIFSFYFSVTVFNILFVELGRNEVNLRMICSSTSVNKMNLHMVVFSLFINLFITVLGLGLGMFFYKEELLSNHSLFFMAVNVFVSGLLAMSISFLTAGIFKNKNILGTINGILASVLMFMGGVYVPLIIFPDWFKQIAKFTPYYWFSEANSLFYRNIPIAGERLWSFLQCIFVQIIFFVLFITISLIIKNKRRADIS